MFISMTGYGRASQSFGDKELVVEIKTVNHKGLDIVVRSPQDFIPFESQIIKYLNQKVQRGRVDVFIGFVSSNSQSEPTVELDTVLAEGYYQSLKALASRLDISKEVTVGQLINLPGIIKTQNNHSRIPASWDLIKPLLDKAAAALMVMRKKEGEELQKDIMSRMNAVEQNVKKIHKWIPQAVKSRQTKLKENIKKLFEDSSFKAEPTQVAAAAISLLDQCDVTEELVRVDSHIIQFYDTAKSGEAAGRRLDFILQELFREFTTIGAKTNHPEIGQKVVDIKTDLDKVKQQIANIE